MRTIIIEWDYKDSPPVDGINMAGHTFIDPYFWAVETGGDGWAMVVDDAERFQTQSEAQDYFDEHRQ